MSSHFETPTDAEDAYYDAIEECDLEKMMATWEDSDAVSCLLPMRPLTHGREPIRELWTPMLNPEFRVEITVNHLQWIEQGDIAIHLLEEMVTLTDSGDKQTPIYAVRIYRNSDQGWHLLSHFNSPTPPPPGIMPPQ
ncbi:MAG: nuclear transport factor 2 family protein [Gammaproteobacteria bacterium]|nr:nuclear transport factor 2 family protein [Gammaproteobacteria bacterium]